MSPAPNRTLAAFKRLLRPAALAATCIVIPLLYAGDASAGQFKVAYFPVGMTRETVPVYDPYGLPFGGSLGRKSWSWSTPLVVSTHTISNPISGTNLSFFGSTVTPNTTDAREWAYQDYQDFNDPGAIYPSTNLLYLYSGGSLGIHVYYYLVPGENVVPDQGGSTPAVSIQNSCDIIGQGDASYGPADDGTGKIVDSSLLNTNDGVLTIDGHASYYGTFTNGLVGDQRLVTRQTIPNVKVKISPTGQRYIDCGTYTVKASILMNAHQCYPAGTYVSPPPFDPIPPFPYAHTFLQFIPFAQGNKADDPGKPFAASRGTLRQKSKWYDPIARRWRFSDKATKMLKGMGINPDTDPRFRPVYGGTITQEHGVSVSHSLADNALMDAADGSGDVADQKMLQQMRMMQIIDAAVNPPPDYFENLPGTWDTDTGTYSDPGDPAAHGQPVHGQPIQKNPLPD